jgi:hypothetical protein
MHLMKMVGLRVLLLLRISDILLAEEEAQTIEDRTETNLVNLRRVIYLTIMNALN